MSDYKSFGAHCGALMPASLHTGCARLDAAARDDGLSGSDARVVYRRTVVRLGPSSVSNAACAVQANSPNHIEGCPDWPPRPPVHSMLIVLSVLLLMVHWCVAFHFAVSGTSTMVAMAQTKAANSRAMATVERSRGTSPSHAITWRGLAKRRKSPISATSVMAQMAATPRKAWIASTTGFNDH